MGKVILSAGLYVVTNLTTCDQAIVSIVGKTPMLSINNVCILEDLAKGKITEAVRIGQISNDIMANPEGYRYDELKIYLKTEEKSKSEKKVELDQYQSISLNYTDYLQLLSSNQDEEAIIKICGDENLAYETGKEVIRKLKLSIRS